MPYPENADVQIIRVPRGVAVPAGALTSGDVTTINNRLGALEAGHPLNDHTDVDTTGIVDGNTLIYDSTANAGLGGYVAGDPSGAIAEVKENGVVDGTDITSLDFGAGLDVVVTGTEADIVLSFAGTGTTTQPAHSDHTHNVPITLLATFAATGVLSSGSRSLYSGNVGPFLTGVFYTITATFLVRARNNVNSGTFNLSCRIGGDASFPTRTRNVQTVGGVPVDQFIHFQRTITGSATSAAVTFSAAYDTGDPVDLRDGEIVITCIPTR